MECKLLSYAELALDTLDGHRHWVFDQTVPKIGGHLQWSGDFFDWYEKTKNSRGFA